MHDKATARALREVIQRDALKLAAGAGIAVERSMLAPLLVARARIRHEPDESVTVEYLSVHGDWFVSGPDIIKEMMSHREFGKVFEPSTPKAAPVKQRETNPFRKGPDFNLTEQMKLLKLNPATAARLMAAATEEGKR